MKPQQIVLVNERDEPVGIMEKMEVHQKGLLHRACSIFIFDSKGRMLLQQRAEGKYHGAHLWTNACCSHPFPDEAVEKAANRRLREELGINTSLQKIFSFTYHAHVENGLIEHEYDHVFAGEYEGEINPDQNEVADYYYEDMEVIKNSLQSQPENFTSWFKIVFPKIAEWWRERYSSQ
jgi:isopentenyl-diphosphate delta-isomerase